jgi:hypothetical protein
MINAIKNYKFDIIWFSLTLLIILAINISYMYSRDRTLNTVEKKQFKIFTKIMYVTSLNSKNFLKIANALTIIPRSSPDKTRQALFHIALITPKGCIENGKHQRNFPLICESFPTSKAIKEILKNKKTQYFFNGHKRNVVEFSTEELEINDNRNRAYLIKKRANTNKWIVAKKRYFWKDSDFEKLYFFLTKRYIQTTSYSSKFYNTKFSALIILITSLLIWLLFKSKELKNRKEYKKLFGSRKDTRDKIIELNSKYNDLKDEIFTLEEEIREEELLLASQHFINTNEKKVAIENIRKKTVLQTEKNGSLIKLRNSIIQLEAEGEVIENLLNEKRIKLRDFERDQEYKKLSNNAIILKQLWRHEPTWKKRKQIETTASLVEDNLPFTLTQAFMSFEKFIDKEIEECLSSEEQEEALDKTLIKKINIVGKCRKLSKSDLNLYHRIRKARNKWVHGAIYPTQDLLNELLATLEKTDITPPL